MRKWNSHFILSTPSILWHLSKLVAEATGPGRKPRHPSPHQHSPPPPGAPQGVLSSEGMYNLSCFGSAVGLPPNWMRPKKLPKGGNQEASWSDAGITSAIFKEERQLLYSELSLDASASDPISMAEPSHPLKEINFSHLCPWSPSFWTYHYCWWSQNPFVYLSLQLAITREQDPSTYLLEAGTHFMPEGNTPLFSGWEPWAQIWRGWLSSKPFQIQLQTAQVDGEGHDLKKPTEMHHLQKAEMQSLGSETEHTSPPA